MIWHVVPYAGLRARAIALIAGSLFLFAYVYRAVRILFLGTIADIKRIETSNGFAELHVQVSRPLSVPPGSYFYVFLPGRLLRHDLHRSYPLMAIWQQKAPIPKPLSGDVRPLSTCSTLVPEEQPENVSPISSSKLQGVSSGKALSTCSTLVSKGRPKPVSSTLSTTGATYQPSHGDLPSKKASDIVFLIDLTESHHVSWALSPQQTVLLDGPYRDTALQTYDTVIMIAQGTGITKILPLVAGLAARRVYDKSGSPETTWFRDRTRRVDLFWWLDDNKQAQSISEQLQNLQALDPENVSSARPS